MKNQIKIIKRLERNLSHGDDSDRRQHDVRDSLEKTKRDAVKIVTGWVSELRLRKAEELAHGFDSLFGKVT